LRWRCTSGGNATLPGSEKGVDLFRTPGGSRFRRHRLARCWNSFTGCSNHPSLQKGHRRERSSGTKTGKAAAALSVVDGSWTDVVRHMRRGDYHEATGSDKTPVCFVAPAHRATRQRSHSHPAGTSVVELRILVVICDLQRKHIATTVVHLDRFNGPRGQSGCAVRLSQRPPHFPAAAAGIARRKWSYFALSRTGD